MTRHIVYPLLFPFFSLVDRRLGFTMFVPTRRGWYAWTRGRFFQVREPGLWVLEYYRRFVPARGGLVLDIGGELGFESRQFSGLVGPAGKVIVFECFPAHVNHLRALAKELGNVVVVDRACWNQDTMLEFFAGQTVGSNTVLPGVRGQRGQDLADPRVKTITVRAQPLDMLWREFALGAEVDFLKMDIEGAEWEALEGASDVLAKTRKAVIAAYHMRDGVRTAARVAHLLRQAGFEVEIGENLHVYASRR